MLATILLTGVLLAAEPVTVAPPVATNPADNERICRVVGEIGSRTIRLTLPGVVYGLPDLGDLAKTAAGPAYDKLFNDPRFKTYLLTTSTTGASVRPNCGRARWSVPTGTLALSLSAASWACCRMSWQRRRSSLPSGGYSPRRSRAFICGTIVP